MYDDVAILIANETTGRDKYGNKVATTSKRTVFVQPRGIYASEFYSAAQLGMKPSLSLYMTNRADDRDEKVLEFHGKRYRVIRVDWNAQRDGITLICEERVDNG